MSVYGEPPIPLLPAALRQLWADEQAPDPVIKAAGCDVFLGELDASIWERMPSMTSAGIRAMVELTARRTDEIRHLPILPAGASPAVFLSRTPLSVRGRNCLRTSGLLESPGSLMTTTFGDLLSIQNLGVKTMLEIVCALEYMGGSVAYLSEPIQSKDQDSPPGGDSPAAKLLDGVIMLSAWALAEHGVTTLGEAVRIPAEARPDDIADLWRAVEQIDAADLASTLGLATDLGHQLSEVLIERDERQLQIFALRTIAFDPLTLGRLAALLGVTRERVRQLEQKSTVHINNRLALRSAVGLRWRAKSVEDVLGAMAPLTHRLVSDEMDRADRDLHVPDSEVQGHEFLVWLAGPYEIKDGWAVHQNRPVDIRAVAADLVRAADSGGILSREDSAATLSAAGIKLAYHAMWLESFSVFRKLDGRLVDSSGNLEVQAARALRRLGKPSSIAEIVDEIGTKYSVRGARSRLMGAEFITRVGKDRFALSHWDGFDEYTGISDEIAQEIGECGGVASLDHLADVLPDRYGVAETSVRVYATAPRFLINSEGDVRVRDASDPPFESGESLELTRSCYLRADHWMVRIPVDRDLLRGSGRQCPGAFADLVGVRPGDSRILPSDSGIDTYVGWALTSAFGPSFGSLREWAAELNLELGDWLYLGYSEGRITPLVVTRTQHESTTGLERLMLVMTATTDHSVDDWQEWMPKAIGLPSGERLVAIRERLRKRGETELIALLPDDTETPATIRESLSGLRGVLGL